MRKLLSLRAISATLLFSVVIFALVACQGPAGAPGGPGAALTPMPGPRGWGGPAARGLKWRPRRGGALPPPPTYYAHITLNVH